MSSYWIQDKQGLVLGPVGLEVIKDLASAKRLTDFTQVSTDGAHWVPVMNLPEVAQVLSPDGGARRAQESAQAGKVRTELERFKTLPVHALFGVSANADVSTYRQGFLALAKPYHPARLPKDVHPDLLRAYMEMFQFLSGRMVEAEKQIKARESVKASLSAAAPVTPKSPADHIRVQQRPSDGRLELTVDVDLSVGGLFTEHKLVNFSTGGMFVPCEHLAPLGTWLEVLLRFSSPSREIRVRGSVVWENLLNSAYPKGYGVRLDRLSDDDKTFLRGFIDQYNASRAKRA